MRKLLIFSFLAPFYLLAQLGIGTVSPHSSAQLEVSSTSKGILIPRMTTTERKAISSPAEGLMVYQTDSVSGFYYYAGSQWQLMKKVTPVAGAVTSLDLTNARLEPSTYTSGVSYTGVLKIAYTGGNGGSFAKGTNISSTGVTGLTATLKGGTLNFGTGELIYNISGTPSASSPSTASFSVPTTLGAAGGTVTIGTGRVLKIGETIANSYVQYNGNTNSHSFNLGNYVASLPTIDGLEANIQGVLGTGTGDYYKPRIYNRASSSQTISYQTFATEVKQNKTALNKSIAPGGFENVDYDSTVYWSSNFGEVITTNVQLSVGGKLRQYEFKWWCMEFWIYKLIFISITRKQ
jgi:hypothetical protein